MEYLRDSEMSTLPKLVAFDLLHLYELGTPLFAALAKPSTSVPVTKIQLFGLFAKNRSGASIGVACANPGLSKTRKKST
jgi:hypothetical protein